MDVLYEDSSVYSARLMYYAKVSVSSDVTFDQDGVIRQECRV